MQYRRQNVWELGGDWAAAILWYARGVAGMKARALADPTSWRFYAAIHGIDQGLWQQYGYLSSSDQFPSSALQQQYWNQCQHGSWYFLPWHRGYVQQFEANIRAVVTSLGGPADWALPYWNYFKPSQNALPPAFASPDWPDGQGNNPLYVVQRYGPGGGGGVHVPVDKINLNAMGDPAYAGTGHGGSVGFGGVDTGFEHGGSPHGGLETQPHDWVHGLVGGADPNDIQYPGLMSDPDTAGLDPIFWLHHCNIDRLWEVWRKSPSTDVNPNDPNWVNGPGSIGERVFSVPSPNGTPWNYTPGSVSDDLALDYTYDDLAPVAQEAPGKRLLQLGAAPKAVSALQGAHAVPSGKNVELMGANKQALRISGEGETQTSVELDSSARKKVTASFALAAQSITPDRVFLNLENVRGLADATAFEVYVGLPKGAKPADHPDLLAGGIALFGVRKASVTDAEHAGKGLTFVLEITKIVDALHLGEKFDVSALDVRIVPVRPVPETAQISIGRVSIFRQGR